LNTVDGKLRGKCWFTPGRSSGFGHEGTDALLASNRPNARRSDEYQNSFPDTRSGWGPQLRDPAEPEASGNAWHARQGLSFHEAFEQEQTERTERQILRFLCLLLFHSGKSALQASKFFSNETHARQP
jgi:hypothetical protein